MYLDWGRLEDEVGDGPAVTVPQLPAEFEHVIFWYRHRDRHITDAGELIARILQTRFRATVDVSTYFRGRNVMGRRGQRFDIWFRLMDRYRSPEAYTYPVWRDPQGPVRFQSRG